MKKFLEKNGIWILLSIVLVFGLSMLYFRNATLDDDLYLRETMIITEVLRTGEWIGNYGVGIHGFVFKLPVALIFFFTGPSLIVATIWNIILGILSLYLFYIILKKIFKSNLWALSGTLLLFTNFQFILNYPTYMREIPALLSLLLVIYVLLFKKSNWILGLSLLLLLDAKEYVLMMIAPGILIYLFISNWFNFKNICFEITKTFLPIVIFILLMIWTTIIPINSFLLSTLPLTETGINYHLRHFEVEVATSNLSSQEGRTIVEERVIEQESSFEKLLNTIKLYVGKILYPYSFSFLSIPKIIFFPALFTSIILLKKLYTEKKYQILSLAFMLYFYSAIFIVKSSFTRYLFPITPVVLIFFLFFLKNLVLEKKKFLTILLITTLFITGGIFFEEEYILEKIFLNLTILISFFSYLYLEKTRNILKILIVFLTSIFSFTVVLFFFYTKGQINEYILWGREYEIHQVVEYFEKDENILLNDPGWDILPLVYRYDTDWEAEYAWELKEWIPRKKHLKNLGFSNTRKLSFQNTNDLREEVERRDIDKVGLIVSELEEYTFPMQENLELLLDEDWLELEKELYLKNKTLFIFKVIE